MGFSRGRREAAIWVQPSEAHLELQDGRLQVLGALLAVGHRLGTQLESGSPGRRGDTEQTSYREVTVCGAPVSAVTCGVCQKPLVTDYQGTVGGGPRRLRIPREGVLGAVQRLPTTGESQNRPCLFADLRLGDQVRKVGSKQTEPSHSQLGLK